MTWWSISDEIVHADAESWTNLIRQAAGEGTNAWRLDVHLTGRAPTTFKIVGLRQTQSDHMHQLLAAAPDWVDFAIQLGVATAWYTF